MEKSNKTWKFFDFQMEKVLNVTNFPVSSHRLAIDIGESWHDGILAEHRLRPRTQVGQENNFKLIIYKQ